MKDKPAYFAILTADVRYCDNLNDGEKLLFAEITALSNKDGFCRAKNSFFAGVFGVSESTIKRRLRGLKKIGFIKIALKKSPDGKSVLSRKIYPITAPVRVGANMVGGGGKSGRGGGGKSGLENNTRLSLIRNQRERTRQTDTIIGANKNLFPPELNVLAWRIWLSYKTRIGDRYKDEQSVQIKIKQLAAIPFDNQMACVEESIGNGWKGLFPKKFRSIKNVKPTKLTRAQKTIQDIEENFGLVVEYDGSKIPELG